MSWEFLVLKIMVLSMLGVYLERPVGSLAGQISLEQRGFGLSSYNMRDNKVYAVATGPRSGPSIERGVWINNDGTFRIDQLPVGEYELKLRATGFGTEYINGLFVEEGKVNQIRDHIAMHLIEPGISIGSNMRVFTTKEKPYLWVNAQGASKARVKIYRTDLVELSASKKFKEWGYELTHSLNLYRSNTAKYKTPMEGEKPLVAVERKLEQDDSDSARADIKLDHALQPGDYLVVAEADAINSTKVATAASWFSVSDLGLVIKQAPEKTLVRAIDLNTLKPIAGASIKVADSLSLAGRGGSGGAGAGGAGAGGSRVKSGSASAANDILISKTGSDGYATIVVPEGLRGRSSFNSMLLGVSGAHRAYGGVSYWRSSSENVLTYFYTDRPVYRLGQTVYYKGLSRYQGANGFKNPGKNVPLNVTIEDPDNLTVWKGNLKTSDHGTFHGVFNIPQEGKTGAYQLTVTYPDNSVSYQNFEVAQYRKPEYVVEVKTLDQRYIAGSKVRAQVKASYFFGGPVANARVKYSIYESTDWSTRYKLEPRPEYYSFFDGWESEEDGYYDSEYGGDYIAEGFAQTDATGTATIEFDSKKPAPIASRPYASQYADKRYKIEAEVTDISRLTVTGSASAQVTAGEFTLFVQPKSYVAKVGDNIGCDVLAVDYDGKPVANQDVVVRLSRWPWDRIKHEYRDEEVLAQTTVTTDANGKVTSQFFVKDQWPTDTFFLSARASDKLGNSIYDQSTVWVASPNYPYIRDGEDADREPLVVKLDKDAYRPGDTAKIMLTAPLTGNEGADAIVTIEGPALYSYRTVPLKATAQLVEIPIEERFAPNVFVSVTIVTKKHQFYTQEKMIKVSPESHFLKLAVSTDKVKYKPGDTVKYTIKANYPDGKPAPNTELSLGVVDESIYSIRPEYAREITRFFYSKRGNWVVTTCSFPEQYSGGPDKVEPQLRKDFKDTAAWVPQIVTDKDGIAITSIKLPDNLTTWRATVRGINMQTDVGATINKVLSTQDVIVRIALPRFFSQGDEGLVTAVVHNYSDKAQSIKVTMTSSPHLRSSGGATTTMELAPEKAARYSWPVSAATPGEAVVQVKAIGQTAGDWMERRLPIRPLGVKAFAAKSGVLSGDVENITLPCQLPEDAVDGTANFIVSMASSTIGPVLGNFDSLIEYPYGCTEQTMSRLIPSIVAIQIHKGLGTPLPAKQKKKFDEVYKRAMDKLVEHHHSDGGWGWWVDDDSNPYLTAYVLEGMHMLKDAGYKPDAQLIKTGRDWLRPNILELKRQLSDPQLVGKAGDYHEQKTDIARALYALSLWKEKPHPDFKNWFLNQALTPEALCYLTMTYKSAGDRQTSRQFYDQLLAYANRSDSYTDWDDTLELLKKVNEKLGLTARYSYSYRFTGVETTALALRTVLSMEPNNLDRLESIKQWLLLHRERDGWGNTKTTAEVFLALLEDDLIGRQRGSTDFTARTSDKGLLLSELKFDAGNRYAPESKMTVVARKEPSDITIEKTGSGRLYYNTLLTYFKKLSRNETLPENGLPRGLRLTRKYFRLSSTATTSDGAIHYRTQPISDGKVKAGETILMKVYVEAPVSVPYIIVEAPLPSGGEVLQNDHHEEEMQGESGGSVIEGDWGSPWWTHQDILDDRIVFFGTSLPAGKSEFHTLLRMELPGTIQVNPVSLEGMYTKSVRAYSPLDSLKVVE